MRTAIHLLEWSQYGLYRGNTFQLSGRERDDDDLYYFRARYYKPSQGRFISEDPVLFGGGQSNFYAYAFNDPILYTDPYGLCAVGIQLGTTDRNSWCDMSSDADGDLNSRARSWICKKVVTPIACKIGHKTGVCCDADYQKCAGQKIGMPPETVEEGFAMGYCLLKWQKCMAGGAGKKKDDEE